MSLANEYSMSINENLQRGPHIPFAGVKQSGFCKENGKGGLRAFTAFKAPLIPEQKMG